MSYSDHVDKERNRVALERIGFHLDEAMRFCSQLDLSGLRSFLLDGLNLG